VVRFDPAQVGPDELVAVVDRTEEPPAPDAPPDRPRRDFPGDPAAVRNEAWALAADLAGLAAAVTGRLVRIPALPGSVAAAAVLVDSQPRLRRVLEDRLGTPAADLVLAATNAVTLGLTQGAAALVVDVAQRGQAVSAARARRAAFERRATALWGAERPGRHEPLPAEPRPVAVPPGPVERYADRAGAGSLVAAGVLLAATGSLDAAGRAILVGAPKPPRAAREAFADTLTQELSGRGAVVMRPAALRLLDRVDAVFVDSRVLHTTRPVVVTARSLSDRWTDERVWTVAQRLLRHLEQPRVPPPAGRRPSRLVLGPRAGHDAGGLSSWSLREDGRHVGHVLLGTELDPLADAVLSSVKASGSRLILSADVAAPELTGRADVVLDARVPLVDHVRRLQAAGHVLAVVSSDEEILARADLGIGVAPHRGRVPWAADVLIGPGLAAAPLLAAAIAGARAVSVRGVRWGTAGVFLGVLLAAAGRASRRRAQVAVTTATALAWVDGGLAARRLGRQPPPTAVLHVPWHALAPDEVVARLPRPTRAALASPTPPGRPSGPASARRLARTIAAELADPLTPVLATGAIASAVVGSPVDALLVGCVVLGNAVISGLQRLRAEQAVGDLLAGQRIPARLVVDGGPPRLVPADSLVPGQAVEIGPGDVVPADGRLVMTEELEVDEATLTGESSAVEKQVEATPGADLADRACMVYEGTTVVAGTGRALVVATGAATEAGRALALAAGVAAPRGMQARLEELTRTGLPATLLGGAAVTALGVLRRQPLRAALASGVSVAVAAVPEGLPLVATVAQTGVARRLSTRGVLVRSARTVEALGRVDTVCFDKTGTLTEGRLRLARLAGVRDQWDVADPAARRLLQAAARAAPRSADGRPASHATDRAVLQAADAVLGGSLELDWEELSELPFQSDRGFSAALGRSADGNLRLVVKGAPEVVLPRCTHQRDEQGKRVLDTRSRGEAWAMVHRLAADGLRVLAVARRTLPAPGPWPRREEDELAPEQLTEDLTLLGFVALADVPRPEAAPTIAALRTAGLRTIMITGDHPVTAQTIAARLGIPPGQVVQGPEFAALDEGARTDLASRTTVFARVSPEQKLRIIGALQGGGRVVAMSGDGANDAAAIRLADVGIGMEAHGSTSARTAADLVLTRPDLTLLLDALVEGRAMWNRVRDAVAVLVGGNAGEVLFTLVGTLLAGRAPLGTRQFLLVNMLTDLLPSMAIALAPSPQDGDQRLGLLRSGAPSLGEPLLRDIAVRGAVTAVGALTAWQVGRLTGTRRRSSTMALAALVGTQLGQTVLAGGRDPLIVVTMAASVLVLAVIVQTPGISQFFGCTPLGPVAWATVVTCAVGTTLLAAVTGRFLGPGTRAGRTDR
jgi:cation-transporting ATPase I